MGEALAGKLGEALAGRLIGFLVEKLLCQVVKEIRLVAQTESHLNDLANTKATVEAFLLDQDVSAITLQNGSQLGRRELQRLRSALAMIDDLLDGTVTRSEIKRGGRARFRDRVRLFFSVDLNPILCLWRDVRHVKGIRKELDSITKDHALLGSIISMLPSTVTHTSASNRETGSDVIMKEVIGRDQERNYIIGKLLDSPYHSSESSPFSVVAIVGIGGLGKTTLAQYVYNDERVKKHFGTLLWVYASRDFDAKEILEKVLASATCEARIRDFGMDEVQRRARGQIEKKKYLLVLDDIWDDNETLREEWETLRISLMHGGRGSKVLITTRNKNVAVTIGCDEPHTLEDFSKEDRWRLFRQVAFTEGQPVSQELEEIGEQIAERCLGVPLVIRTVAATLHNNRTVDYWVNFRDKELPSFVRGENGIMESLRRSYNELNERLKLCFASCSLFPKGYEFDKHELICLWIALGHVEARYDQQSLEESAEEYMASFIQLGFLQVEEKDDFEDHGFAMHDLIHDLALSVSSLNYKMADSLEFEQTVGHVSFSRKVKFERDLPTSLQKTKEKLRALLLLGWYPPSEVQLKELAKFHCLRALRLPGIGLEEVPTSIGRLIHLRYLNLSFNYFRNLPNSITRLINLFCVDLTKCYNLKGLPRNMRKLVNLRHLHLKECHQLSYMPLGLGDLTSLEILDKFVLGGNQSIDKSNHNCCGTARVLVGGLNELSYLNNLKGGLEITLDGVPKDKLRLAKTANLEGKEKLNSLRIIINPSHISKEKSEMVLDTLRPHVNLRNLVIYNYKGEKLPDWMMELGYLHKLSRIELEEFEGSRYLCALGGLPHLKILELSNMSTVEYIEQITLDTPSDQPPAAHPLFPSLEELTLYDMPSLKGWSITMSTSSNSSNQQEEDLRRQRLLKYQFAFPNLKKLKLSWVGLEVVPEEFQGAISLESLEIWRCPELKDIPEWIHNFTNLQQLHIYDCPKLAWLPKQIDNLSNLDDLEIKDCPSLAQTYNEEAGQDEQFFIEI